MNNKTDYNCQDNGDDFFRCNCCNRTFNHDSIDRHQIICNKRKLECACNPFVVSKTNISDDMNDTDKEVIKISDMIQKRHHRRKQWREEHFMLANELSSFQKNANLIENISPVSNMPYNVTEIDISEDISCGTHGSQFSKKNKTKSSKIKTKSVSNDHLYSINSVKESGDREHSKSTEKPGYMWKLVKVDDSPKEKHHRDHKHKRSKTSKNSKHSSEKACIEKKEEKTIVIREFLSDMKQSRDIENGKDNHKRNVSNGVLKPQHTENVLDDHFESNKNADDFSRTSRISSNNSIEKYEERMNRILQHYSEKYWSEENQFQQKTCEKIPTNLSGNRLRLEKLKQFNNQSKENDNSREYHKCREFNDLNKTFKNDSDLLMLNNQTSQNFYDKNNNQINKNVRFIHDMQTCPSSIDQDNCAAIESPIEPRFERYRHRTVNSNTIKLNSNMCNCFYPKSILKKTEMDEIDNCENRMMQRIYRAQPFVNTKLDKFKQHQININSVINSENKDVEIIRDNDEKPTNHVNQPVIKEPIVNNKTNEVPCQSKVIANKTFQIFGGSMAVTNQNMLRDEEYTKAWQIKL